MNQRSIAKNVKITGEKIVYLAVTNVTEWIALLEYAVCCMDANLPELQYYCKKCRSKNIVTKKRKPLDDLDNTQKRNKTKSFDGKLLGL